MNYKISKPGVLMEKLWSRRGGLLSLSSTTANLIFKSNLSTSAAAITASSSNATVAAATKPKRKKNLFEVAQFLPNWGIGYHLAKSHWKGVSYQITKLNLYKDGKHGKAWGIVHKEGLSPADAPKKISGVHKRCWKYIPKLPKTEEVTPKPETQVA